MLHPDSRSRPDCSVCIANFNGEHLLDECLGSVFAQAGELSIEVIVHDDASTDGSLAVLQRYPQVVVLPSDTNVGFCIANNRMVAKATGEYVLLLNNDAALFPDGLRVLLEEARSIGGGVILSLPQYDWHTGELVDRGCLFDPFCNPVPNLDASRDDVAMVMGACLFTSRSLWLELGGFPEWMGSLAEDAYLCCRARLRGVPVRVAKRSGYRHRQGSSFGGSRVDAGKLSTTYRRRYLSERNKTAVMVICTPTPLAWPLLALHLMLLVCEGALLTLMKRDGRVWREIYALALHWIMRELGALRRHRRDVQRGRRATCCAYWHCFVLMPRKLELLRRYGLPRLR